MSYDDIIEVLAAALLEKAETVGCLEVLDGFSQRPDTEIEVSAPISEEMLALPLDKQEWPEECTPILKESSAATLGELVEYLKPYPIPEIKPEQMDKAIKELERLSPVSIVYQNEGVVGYDAEQHAIVFPTAMPQCEVLARLPAEIVIATAEQCEPGIAQAPYMRKTAMAVSVEFCGRFSLPMPDTAAATLDGMDTHIPPGEERKTLEEIRELSVTIGDTVEKALGLQRGQSAPQRDEAR